MMMLERRCPVCGASIPHRHWACGLESAGLKNALDWHRKQTSGASMAGAVELVQTESIAYLATSLPGRRPMGAFEIQLADHALQSGRRTEAALLIAGLLRSGFRTDRRVASLHEQITSQLSSTPVSDDPHERHARADLRNADAESDLDVRRGYAKSCGALDLARELGAAAALRVALQNTVALSRLAKSPPPDIHDRLRSACFLGMLLGCKPAVRQAIQSMLIESRPSSWEAFGYRRALERVGDLEPAEALETIKHRRQDFLMSHMFSKASTEGLMALARLVEGVSARASYLDRAASMACWSRDFALAEEWAREALAFAKATGQDTNNAKMTLVAALFGQEDFAKAKEAFDVADALSTHPLACVAATLEAGQPASRWLKQWVESGGASAELGASLSLPELASVPRARTQEDGAMLADEPTRARNLAQAAIVYYDSGDGASCMRCLEAMPKASHWAWESIRMNLRAAVARDRGALEEAETLWRTRMGLAAVLNSEEDYYQSLGNLATVLIERGDADAAMAALDRAVEFFSSCTKPSDQVKAEVFKQERERIWAWLLPMSNEAGQVPGLLVPEIATDEMLVDLTQKQVAATHPDHRARFALARQHALRRRGRNDEARKILEDLMPDLRRLVEQVSGGNACTYVPLRWSRPWLVFAEDLLRQERHDDAGEAIEELRSLGWESPAECLLGVDTYEVFCGAESVWTRFVPANQTPGPFSEVGTTAQLLDCLQALQAWVTAAAHSHGPQDVLDEVARLLGLARIHQELGDDVHRPLALLPVGVARRVPWLLLPTLGGEPLGRRRRIGLWRSRRDAERLVRPMTSDRCMLRVLRREERRLFPLPWPFEGRLQGPYAVDVDELPLPALAGALTSNAMTALLAHGSRGEHVEGLAVPRVFLGLGDDASVDPQSLLNMDVTISGGRIIWASCHGASSTPARLSGPAAIPAAFPEILVRLGARWVLAAQWELGLAFAQRYSTKVLEAGSSDEEAYELVRHHLSYDSQEALAFGSLVFHGSPWS